MSALYRIETTLFAGMAKLSTNGVVLILLFEYKICVLFTMLTDS